MSGFTERAEGYRALVQHEMREVVGASPDGLYAWMRYHLGWEDRTGQPVTASPGKMLRPVALLLAAEIAGGDPARAVPAAAAVELIHNFSLLHDDVEDRSDFRRGRANVWTFAGVAQAINTGDGMFTVARLAEYRLLDRGVDPAVAITAMREIDEACIRLVEGQYHDISFETRRDVTAEEYERMAAGKTAAMFAAPLAAGAILGGAPPPLVDAFREYGRRIGIGFQMVDDILGIWGDPAVTGKPVADDLLTRKMTYPVIAALDAGDDHAAALAGLYATPPGPSDDIAAMTRHIEATGARRLTQERAEREEAEGLAALRAAGLGPEALAWAEEFAAATVVRVS